LGFESVVAGAAQKIAGIARWAIKRGITMKMRMGFTTVALLLTGAAGAQQLPDVEGHPENALILSDPAKAAAGNYKLDPSHTSVVGRVLHGKLSFYSFRFDKVDGSYVYDPARPEVTKVEVTIDPASIDSNLPTFDRRLKGPDFLDAEKYNLIEFVATEIKRTDMTHGTMTGSLSFHGVTRPITLNVIFNGGGPAGRRIEMGYSANALLKMLDYGMGISAHNIGDTVSLAIETEFINQDQKTELRQIQRLQSRSPEQ
jgi:polyisoprenoid-binding protein YceI